MPIDKDDGDGTSSRPSDHPPPDDPSPEDDAPAEPQVTLDPPGKNSLGGPSLEQQPLAEEPSPEDDAPPDQPVSTEVPRVSVDQAVTAAERNGLDLSSVDIGYEAPDAPNYVEGYGHSRFNFDDTPYVNENGKYEMTLQVPALTSEKEAVVSIAHEWAHLYIVGPYDEDGAEAYAQEVGRRFH